MHNLYGLPVQMQVCVLEKLQTFLSRDIIFHNYPTTNNSQSVIRTSIMILSIRV